jgi:cytochrome c-type biogenesis protein
MFWARLGSLLLAYGAGPCAVIVAAGTGTEMGRHFLNWNEHSKGVTVVKRVRGALVRLADLCRLTGGGA